MHISIRGVKGTSPVSVFWSVADSTDESRARGRGRRPAAAPRALRWGHAGQQEQGAGQGSQGKQSKSRGMARAYPPLPTYGHSSRAGAAGQDTDKVGLLAFFFLTGPERSRAKGKMNFANSRLCSTAA